MQASDDQRQMVDYSVRAQDYIVKQQKQSIIGSDAGTVPVGSVDTTVPSAGVYASAKRSFEDSMIAPGRLERGNSHKKVPSARDHDLLGPL